MVSVPIPAMQGSPGGSSGQGSLSLSDVNKYDAIAGLNKTLILAKLYRG